MTRAPGNRRGSRGQAAVEFALAAPFIVVLLLGSLDLTFFFADTLTGGSAAREGARLASEIGAGNGSMTTSQADQQIVQSVLTAAAGLNDATVQEVDIYTPGRSDGVFSPGSDPADVFDGKGNPVPGKQTFPLSQRKQRIPDETSIGVRLVWRFVPPMGVGTGLLTFSQYSVFKAVALPS
ncbi:MAG: TadE/TadG family type IV pilus assembly protein [Candidatus Dormibacteraceae bacterium]